MTARERDGADLTGQTLGGRRRWWIRIAGTSACGWMSDDNLKGRTGPSTHC